MSQEISPKFGFFDSDAQRAVDSGRWFEHMLSGVTMPSRDGSDRQMVVRSLRPGQEVRLVREPQNEYDHNAILVQNYGNQSAGYVSAKPADFWARPGGTAGFLSPRIDAGEEWRAFVRAVLGGDGRSLGVRVVFVQISGEGLGLPGHYPLSAAQMRADSSQIMPMKSEAFGLIGDLISWWSWLDDIERSRINDITRRVMKLGGAPIQVRDDLRGYLDLIRDRISASYARQD